MQFIERAGEVSNSIVEWRAMVVGMEARGIDAVSYTHLNMTFGPIVFLLNTLNIRMKS